MIGVLAIQGDFAAHVRMLFRLGEPCREVRNVCELDGISGLIIPGGESTTLLHFLQNSGWMQALRTFGLNGRPILGTCAGAILLAAQVLNPQQSSLELADISITRNAYGRQINSFIAKGASEFGSPELEMVFIRAPRIDRVGPQCKTLAKFHGSPVLVQDRRNLLATFHPELSSDHRVHQHFLSIVRGAS